MIPVSVLTGFLGSGKTTLLARLMRDPTMGKTAIINEFGAIGLDHDLIETSEESFVQLSNGCLCCNVRSDLTLTLADLAARRVQGTVPPFERVVIETSGLADPAPILHALMMDRDLAGVYTLDGVITTVDALLGISTLDNHEQSRRQIAVADRIVITKTDVADAQTNHIRQRLAVLNPGAQVTDTLTSVLSPAVLFDCGSYDLSGKHPDVGMWLAHESVRAANTPQPQSDDNHKGYHRHSHTDDYTSISLVREAPLRAVTLPLLLSALAENCGTDLLRMKGIVHVLESPERPAVIHGVQHVYHAPVWLPQWPSADRRTRMVLIGHNLRESWVRMLIDMLDAEVAVVVAKCD